jgi:hypothetical protein
VFFSCCFDDKRPFFLSVHTCFSQHFGPLSSFALFLAINAPIVFQQFLDLDTLLFIFLSSLWALCLLSLSLNTIVVIGNGD